MADQSTINRQIASAYHEYEAITSLRSALAHHRFHTYRQRKNALARLAIAERTYRRMLAELSKEGVPAPYSLFGKQLPTRRSGLNVRVELSLDGLAYSNPAPAVPHSAHVWVRAIIEEAHTGELGIPKTHEIYHLTWAYSKVYHPIDGVPASGRDEYVVSSPLVCTREFTAPSSGSTKHNFFVYVDIYEAVDS